MKFSIDPLIFETYPGLKIGILHIKSMNNSGQNGEILALLRSEELRQHENLLNAELGKLPEIAAWRQIYKSFGSDPHDFKSSIEALLKRAKHGAKPLPQINPLVDLYNFVSLKYHMPVGAEDLDAIRGNLRLCYSVGTERGRVLGSDHDEVCEAGEIVYADDEGFVCRRFNYREADRTKITGSTRRSVLVIEKAPVVAEETLAKAMGESCNLIEKFIGGTCTPVVMSRDMVSVDIS